MHEQQQERNRVYRAIIAEAQAKAQELRHTLPPLPSQQALEPFAGRMYARDASLIASIKRHLEAWDVAHARGFDHLEWVGVNGAFVAAEECQERGINGDMREEIIQRAWRLGLLHDLQRWWGYGKEHMIEGSLAAQQLLHEQNLADPYLAEQVRVHDDVVIEARNDPRFDIPLFSVFAVDHLNWGLERKKALWEEFQKKQVDPEKAIHDYAYLERMHQSPNFQQTRWGREVALPYIGFGLAIARHIEQLFQQPPASSVRREKGREGNVF